ncbi:hypothetical protein BH11PLA2_BH11PLA2_45470 [soil metagenome]
MADPLAERLSQTLFGTTTRTDVEMVEFTNLMPRPKQTQPCEGDYFPKSSTTNVWITTNACDFEHTVRLIRLPDHKDMGLKCTYTPPCPATMKLYTTYSCDDFQLPDTEGTYVFEIEVDGTITLGAVIRIGTRPAPAPPVSPPPPPPVTFKKKPKSA